MNRNKSLCLAIVASIALAWGAPSAEAAPITLADKNSVVEIDPTSQSGAFSWTVDGIDQLNQQWFWLRPGNVPEVSLDAIPLVFSLPIDINGDTIDNALFLSYQQAGANGFRIDIFYSLIGGAPGSGTADLAEQISITNTGSQTLTMSFFQYCDFDLNGTSLDDTIVLSNANAMTQSDGAMILAETVVTPVATRYETNIFPATRTKLNDGVATNLNNDPGPYAGDVTWAFQWNISLPVNRTFIISKDKHIQVVPEPSTLALLGAGLLALAPVVRRRHRKSA